MAILTELPFAEATGLLAAYDLRLSALVPLAAGSVNSNFFIRALNQNDQEQELFARIYEEQGDQGAAFELTLNEKLGDAGLPVALPIRASGQQLFCQYRGKPFALYQRLAGEVSCQRMVNPARCFAVGEALARVHSADLGDLVLKPSRFGFDQIRQRLIRVRESARPSLQSAADRIEQDCQRFENARDPHLPKGLIHGDLFRDNVLLAGDEVSGLLDFESASLGTYVYDLMVTILAWCYGSSLELALVQGMLAGYQSIRPLSVPERSALMIEGCVACVRFATTRLTDFSLRTAEGERPGRDFQRFFERQAELESGVIGRALA